MDIKTYEINEEEDNYYLNKIDNILNNNTIYSNDDLVLEKLQNKIADLEEVQDLMKKVNAYYRKNKTLDGCELLPANEIEKIKNNMQFHSWYDAPFAPFELTNNNANIKRLKGRVAEITRLKERASESQDNKYETPDGVTVVENAEIMRLQILFDDIPTAEVRDLLKKNGFKWSPKNSAWQRQLTQNGISATINILQKLKQKEE